MTESRLGLGWKAPRRRCWCEEGRISAAKARFTRSPPSTPPILTTEFVIADLRALRRFGEYGAVAAAGEREFPKLLWRLHRNEPGWFVGEQRQVRFWLLCRFTAWLLFMPTEIDRLGEIGRSRENRTVDADGDAPPRTVTRVGEVERWKKVVAVREEKLELDDANADEEADGDEV